MYCIRLTVCSTQKFDISFKNQYTNTTNTESHFVTAFGTNLQLSLYALNDTFIVNINNPFILLPLHLDQIKRILK